MYTFEAALFKAKNVVVTNIFVYFLNVNFDWQKKQRIELCCQFLLESVLE